MGKLLREKQISQEGSRIGQQDVPVCKAQGQHEYKGTETLRIL